MELGIDVHVHEFIAGKSKFIRVDGHGHEIPIDDKNDRFGTVCSKISAVSKICPGYGFGKGYVIITWSVKRTGNIGSVIGVEDDTEVS